MKNRFLYFSFILLSVAILVVYPKEGKFQYDYQKGRPWIYETLISPIDFPVLKTQDEMLREKEEKASEVVDYYDFDASVSADCIGRFNSLAIESGLDKSLHRDIVSRLDEAYRVGIVPDLGDDNLDDKVIIIKKDKRIREVPAVEVSDINRVYTALKVDLTYTYPQINIDSVLSSLNIKSFITANLHYDEKTTQLVHKEAVNYISPTKGMIYAGQLIVSKGEIVSSDICQLLDSYKAEYKTSFGFSGSEAMLWLCHSILAVCLAALLFSSIYFTDKSIFADRKKLLFFIILFFIAFAGTSLLYKLDPRLLYMMPFGATVLYASAFFKRSVVIAVYTVILLPLLLIPENGTELFVINLATGSVALLAFNKFSRGWLQFVNVAYMFVAMFIVYFAFNAMFQSPAMVVSDAAVAFLAVNALFVIVLYPFVYIFEKLFSFVSYTRLWELSDTNNKLLRELQTLAPGSFQHSLQVANLAENAAREISADAMLVRVGALYHDIGKIKNPMCFVENQAPGVDYHKDLSPQESAGFIINHVSDGLALASSASLPAIVSDFISTHHAQTMTRYFYNVYCNNGGDSSNTQPFTYKGKFPETKEQVILMMADSVEAASRTLKDYTNESISNLVDSIIAQKISENQINDADISLKEIEVVKNSFKIYLRQIYHARISYPKQKGRQ